MSIRVGVNFEKRFRPLEEASYNWQSAVAGSFGNLINRIMIEDKRNDSKVS